LTLQNDNDLEKIKNDMFSFFKSGLICEDIPVYEIIVKHQLQSRFTKEQFIGRVRSVVSQFGAIIKETKDYKEVTKSKVYQGQISVFMYTSEFAIPFSGMINRVMKETDHFIYLKIPSKIIDPVLIQDANIRQQLQEYFNNNNISLQMSGFKWIGKQQEVQKALQLLQSNQPIIKFKQYPIPGQLNILQVHQKVRFQNRKGMSKWYLNLTSRSLFVPDDIPEETVNAFIRSKSKSKRTQTEDENFEEIDGIEPIFGDIEMCEKDAILSRDLINMFLGNGKIVQRNFCVRCIHELFSLNLREMYDEQNDTIVMENILNNDKGIDSISLTSYTEDNEQKNPNSIQFPIIPFGQLVWAFLNEISIQNQTRVWITALAQRTLKHSPKITFCPQHPHTLFPSERGEEIKCLIPGCNFCKCRNCNKWHKSGECKNDFSIPPGSRICPYCHNCVMKSSACNHITCLCGKHFCYFCGAGPYNTPGECYSHLREEHQDYFRNPPDYRKYYLGENVSDQELQEFYRQYSKKIQWRP